MKEFIFAIPKGRIKSSIGKFLHSIGIEPEEEFFDDNSRRIKFGTNIETLSLIIVRNFDIAKFIAYGVAHFGIVGKDVLDEFDYRSIYDIFDLKLAQCRLSLIGYNDSFLNKSHLKICTKYPNSTRKFFEKKDIYVDTIKLNGAIEIAIELEMCDAIVDLVDSGRTIREHNLQEIQEIAKISSHFVVHKNSYHLLSKEMHSIILNIKSLCQHY